ncbi:acyl-CoA dehydrogenase family protein, partial [Thermodesulfobacteriota bacterium]
IEECERKCKFPVEIWKKACELGYIGMCIPEKYGGQELGLLESSLVFETFCRQDSGTGLALALSDLGSEIILRYGNEEQKKKYLPSICGGKGVISLAYLEKGQENGMGPFETTATKKGDGYVINGTKIFVSNITQSGPVIVLCRLTEGSRAGENAAFLIKKDLKGLASSLFGDRVGMRMVPVGNLAFMDVLVPDECLLGDGRDGQSQLNILLNEMNVKAAATGTGIAQGAFDMALAYARRREQFGRKIGSFEAIRGKLTDMLIRIELSRLMTYKAAWDLDGNSGNSVPAAMAKKVAAETALEVARDSLHIFGGYGYIVDYRIERFYRDASMIDIIGLPGHSHESFFADQAIGKM